jgi:hypothetical protein
MLATQGGSDAPTQEAALERVRSRIRSRVPHVTERCQRLLRLAALGAQGSDPEAALARLEAAQRTLAVFLKLTSALLLAPLF